MELLGLTVAYALGVDPRRIAVLGVAVVMPSLALGIVAALLWRARRGVDPAPALFCSAVASELRAGATLREAIQTACTSVARSPLAEAIAQAPMPLVARLVGAEFAGLASELEATVLGVAHSGGRAADLFDELAGLAIAQNEIRHEIRVAATPAHATATIFVLAPAVYLLWQTSSGALDDLFASPSQQLVSGLGITFFLIGLAWAGLVLWRAR